MPLTELEQAIARLAARGAPAKLMAHELGVKLWRIMAARMLVADKTGSKNPALWLHLAIEKGLM